MKLRKTMKTLPMLALMMSLCGSGCAIIKETRVLDPEKAVSRVRKGESYTPVVDGWFVPDARWLEMNQVIAEKSVVGK